MLRFVVATCLLAIAAGQVVPIKTEEFQCAGRDGLFPNENDCSTFFNCGHDGTQAWKQECQAGLVFNPEIGACDWASNYACEAKSPTTAAPEPTTPAPEPTTAAPEPTTAAPEPTTAAPEPTTAAPEPTTAAPEPTTAAPEPTTAVPEPTTAAPEPTTAEPEAEFENEGCYKNKMPHKVTLLERTDKRLDKYNYKRRENAIQKCFEVAKDAGYAHFAIGNKGQCWGSKGDEYAEQGEAKVCPAHGKGKYAVINVYSIAANQ